MISYAQDMSLINDNKMQNEWKWSFVSLVNTITKQEKQLDWSKNNVINVGYSSAPKESLAGSFLFVDTITNLYAKEIDMLYKLGVVRWCSKDKFCPNNHLKRYELISMIVRILNLQKSSSWDIESLPFDDILYADVRITDDYAQEVYQAKTLGLLNVLETKKYGQYYLEPNAPVTDMEILSMIRYVLWYEWQEHVLEPIIITKAQWSFLLVQAFNLSLDHKKSVIASNLMTKSSSTSTSSAPSWSAGLIQTSSDMSANMFTYWLYNTLKSLFV